MGTFIHLDTSSDRRIPDSLQAQFADRLLTLFQHTGMYDMETVRLFDATFRVLKKPSFRYVTHSYYPEESGMECYCCFNYFESYDRHGWETGGYSEKKGMFSGKVGGYFQLGMTAAYLLYQQYLSDPSFLHVDWIYDPDPKGQFLGLFNNILGTDFKMEPFNLFKTGWKLVEYKKSKGKFNADYDHYYFSTLHERANSFKLALQWYELVACVKGTREAIEASLTYRRKPEDKEPGYVYPDDILERIDFWVENYSSKAVDDPSAMFESLFDFVLGLYGEKKMEKMEDVFCDGKFVHHCFEAPLYLLKKASELFLVDFDDLLKQHPYILDFPVHFEKSKEVEMATFYDKRDLFNLPFVSNIEELEDLDEGSCNFLAHIRSEYEQSLKEENHSTMREHFLFLEKIQDAYCVYPFEETIESLAETGNTKEVKAFFEIMKKTEASDLKNEEKTDRLQALLACAYNPVLRSAFFPGLIKED